MNPGRLLIFCLLTGLCIGPGSALARCEAGGSPDASSSRFRIRDAEILDPRTHLIWQRCSIGTRWSSAGGCVGRAKLMTLDEARRHASRAGGGWRVPDIDELLSLVEQACGRPAIDPKIFPGVRSLVEGGAPYWSTTRVRELPMLFHYVDFMSGEVDGHTPGISLGVRLVRNAP